MTGSGGGGGGAGRVDKVKHAIGATDGRGRGVAFTGTPGPGYSEGGDVHGPIGARVLTVGPQPR